VAVEVSPDPGKIVLVVDDQEQVRKLTCRILQRAGYSVLSAPGGQEALKISRAEGTIHLLLSDVEMPGMSGLELSSQFKVERPDTAVLLYSANHAHASSEFPFLGKPFRPNDLLHAVTAALDSQPALPAVEPAVEEPVPVAPAPVVEMKSGRRQARFKPYLMAAGVVVCLAPLALLKMLAPGADKPDTVNLQTARGLTDGAAAKAGRNLILKLNLTGIPRHASYRIELVDAGGHLIWQQVVPAANSPVLQARSAALHAGVFFVRAYAAPEGLLREYELDIGENH
jgi:CheY-like chemotaxis protein